MHEKEKRLANSIENRYFFINMHYPLENGQCAGGDYLFLLSLQG